MAQLDTREDLLAARAGDAVDGTPHPPVDVPPRFQLLLQLE